MPLEGVEQPVFSKLFSTAIQRLSDAIGVQRQDVARFQTALRHRTFPVLEETQHGARGSKLQQTAVISEKKGREMSAVGIAQAARLIVIDGEEEAGIGVVGRVFLEELVYRLQK